MSIDWNSELEQITAAAKLRNIDPLFVRTIRAIEDGRPGREFGVLAAGVDSYAQQLAEAAATVAHRLTIYPSNPLVRRFSADGSLSRIVYSPSFISYFASVWAPVGASNDPDGLNRNWLANALSVYDTFVLEELNAR